MLGKFALEAPLEIYVSIAGQVIVASATPLVGAIRCTDAARQTRGTGALAERSCRSRRTKMVDSLPIRHSQFASLPFIPSGYERKHQEEMRFKLEMQRLEEENEE